MTLENILRCCLLRTCSAYPPVSARNCRRGNDSVTCWGSLLNLTWFVCSLTFRSSFLSSFSLFFLSPSIARRKEPSVPIHTLF